MKQRKKVKVRAGMVRTGFCIVLSLLALPGSIAQNPRADAPALPSGWRESAGSRQEWVSGNIHFVIADVSRASGKSGEVKERGVLFAAAKGAEAEHQVILRHDAMEGFGQPRSVLSEWLKKAGTEANRTFKTLSGLVKNQFAGSSLLKQQVMMKFLGNQGPLLTGFLGQLLKKGGNSSKSRVLDYTQRGVDVSSQPGGLSNKISDVLKQTTKDALGADSLYSAIRNMEKTDPFPIVGALVPPRGGRIAPAWSLQNGDILLLWRPGVRAGAAEPCRLAVLLNQNEQSSNRPAVAVADNDRVRTVPLSDVISQFSLVVALRRSDVDVRQRSEIAHFLKSRLGDSTERPLEIVPPQLQAMKRDVSAADLGVETDTWLCSGLFLQAFQEAGVPLAPVKAPGINTAEPSAQNRNSALQYVGHLKY